jgi:hypothetical protein
MHFISIWKLSFAMASTPCITKTRWDISNKFIVIDGGSLEHQRAQKCFWVPKRAIDVPSILLQTCCKWRSRRSHWKHLEWYSRYVESSWVLECSWEHSKNLKAFCIPPPRFIVLNVPLNVPLNFLQTFFKHHVVGKNLSNFFFCTFVSIELSNAF